MSLPLPPYFYQEIKEGTARVCGTEAWGKCFEILNKDEFVCFSPTEEAAKFIVEACNLVHKTKKCLDTHS